MPGWDDLTGTPGSLSSSYVLDITFFNTYIKALKEKTQFIQVNVGSFPDVIDDTKPFILHKSFVQNIVDGYGRMMKNIDWIKKARFDAPADYDPMDDDTDDIWTLAEIETHIGSDEYDILDDPSSYGIKDLLSADLWNAMYKLYKDVFIYIEQRELKSSVVSWEQYGFNGAYESLTVTSDPNDVTDFLSDSETDYDAETVSLLSSGSGLKTFNTSLYQFARKTELPQENPRVFATSDFSANSEYDLDPKYTKRIHTIENYDGDYVALGYSAQGILSANHIYDSWGNTGAAAPRLGETFALWISGFSQIDPSDPSELIEYTFDSSTVTGSGWELVGQYPTTPAYNCDEPDFVYDYDDMYDGTHGLDRRTDKQHRFNLIAGDTTGNADLYYNTNVSGMIYNP